MVFSLFLLPTECVWSVQHPIHKQLECCHGVVP